MRRGGQRVRQGLASLGSSLLAFAGDGRVFVWEGGWVVFVYLPGIRILIESDTSLSTFMSVCCLVGWSI